MKKILLTLFTITYLFDCSYAQVSAYPFTSTTGTYTAITGGTLLGDTSDDEERFVDPAAPLGGTTLTGVGLPIGFNFTYNGLVFDRLAINTNGWISLGQSSLTPSVNISSSSSYNPLSGTSTATPTLLRNRIAALTLDLEGQAGSSLRIETIGSAPNRVCVIQWANYSKYLETGDNFNFQIRLKETSNSVEIIYGAMTNNATPDAAQVGLGGTLPSDFNLRTTATNWAATTAGTVNTDECDLTATVKPASGQTYTWTVPSPCTGTPTAGTASGPTGICSGINFDLVLAGYTSGVSGITLQWQSSSSIGGTYTNISGATSATYTATQTATTYYKCIVTCSGGTAVASNVVTVTLNAPSACHCIPSSTSCTTDKITNVTIGTINNTSTCGANGYTSYTSPTATLNTSIAYPISVIVGSTSLHVGVWIDYNQNGVFDASEFTYLGTGSTTISSTITIPGTATLGATKMRVRARYSTILAGTDACTPYTWGETEDYAITIGAGAACSGTPTAGTATGPTGVCSGISFDLVLTGYTSGVSGITLQWQSASSIGGTYTNISGATSATYSATQTATTYYKCLVTCSGGTSAASNIVTVTLNAPSACYCTPPTSSCSSSLDKITNVTIGTINNTTTCGTDGYTAYTTPTATLNQAVSYPVSVTVGSASQHVAAWIDYNQNGTFETAEFTYLGTGSTTITSAIVISGTATLGTTRMRIRARYGTTLTGADACLGYGYGETEDYTITIAAGTPCTGTPTAGTATAANDTVCNGVDFDLVLTGYTTGVAGISFQWQSSSTSGGTYTDISGATTSTYTASQTETTYYKCLVTCNGGTAVASNMVTVYMTPIMDCYCISTATSVSDEDIFNVTVGTLNNTSSCTTTGGAGSVLNKYSNYTDTVAAPSFSRTAVVPFSVQTGSCGTGLYSNAFKIFIDYNQNGSFDDAGENVYSSDTVKGPQTKSGTFTVPSTAGIGNTLMRVVCRETSDTSSISSCGTYSWGETEDYLVNITSLSGIEENKISGIVIYPNPTTGLFNIATANANFTDLTISVMDIQGKEVFSNSDKNYSSTYNKQINLEGLAKGIYYIRLNTGTAVKTQKLIIQ